MKLCQEHGIDVQELDSTLLFSEQTVVQNIVASMDDGVHNEAARELLGLGKYGRRSKRKGHPMDIGKIFEAVEYLGAPVKKE